MDCGNPAGMLLSCAGSGREGIGFFSFRRLSSRSEERISLDSHARSNRSLENAMGSMHDQELGGRRRSLCLSARSCCSWLLSDVESH